MDIARSCYAYWLVTSSGSIVQNIAIIFAYHVHATQPNQYQLDNELKPSTARDSFYNLFMSP